jgi:hypothetical protein
MTSRRWGNVTKIIVITLLVLFALSLVITFRAMIQPTIVAFLFTFILGYPVNWIQRQTGWARGTAVLVLYVFLAPTDLKRPGSQSTNHQRSPRLDFWGTSSFRRQLASTGG